MSKARHKPVNAPPPIRDLRASSSPITTLVHMVKRLQLGDDPHLRDLIVKIAMTNRQDHAAKLLPLLARDYYEKELDPFAVFENDDGGRWHLGQDVTTGETIGLSDEHLPLHTVFTGATGTGKSTGLLSLHRQARGRCHCLFIDRKGDADFLVREGFDVVLHEDFFINPLLPPSAAIPIEPFRNEHVAAFAELEQFMTRGESVYHIGVDALLRDYKIYERWSTFDWSTMHFPTMFDLLELFEREIVKRVRGQGRESVYSIIEKLHGLLIGTGPMFRCERGVSIKRLWEDKRAVCLNVSGLQASHQNYVLVTLLQHYGHLLRAHARRNTLQVLVLFDEAGTLFGV